MPFDDLPEDLRGAASGLIPDLNARSEKARLYTFSKTWRRALLLNLPEADLTPPGD
jgi:hypothetical protein